LAQNIGNENQTFELSHHALGGDDQDAVALRQNRLDRDQLADTPVVRRTGGAVAERMKSPVGPGRVLKIMHKIQEQVLSRPVDMRRYGDRV
jgi:hypothetical protein